MDEWYRTIQACINTMDHAIEQGADEKLTLKALSQNMGYSAYHMTRKFHYKKLNYHSMY